MRNVFLKTKNQRDFENKGYSTMPMLSSQEVDLVLSELQLMKPDDNFNPERASEQPSYHITDFDQNLEYKIKAKRLISSILEPHLNNIFDDYKIVTTNFIIKPPGKGKFTLHHDWTCILDTNNYTSLSLWCPLVDTNEENGTLKVVEGSHKIVPDIATSTVSYYCKNIENTVIEKYGMPICLKAGECIVFDHSLLHFSDDNHSSHPRYVMQAILVPREITPVFYYFDVNEPNKGFEVFETEPNFFIWQDFFQRPSNLRSLGFIENRNRFLTEEEFIEKMKNGRQIREEKYFKPALSQELGTNGKFLSFFNLLRGNDWWFYKISPLLAIVYAEIILQGTSPQRAIITPLILLVSMFFVAAYGFKSTFGSIKEGKQTGKNNDSLPKNS